MDRSMHVVGGKPWQGQKVSQGAVVWVAAELSDDLYDNYEAVKIFMPAGREKPAYAPYIEHVPPDHRGDLLVEEQRPAALARLAAARARAGQVSDIR
jgi:hypothetical protein